MKTFMAVFIFLSAVSTSAHAYDRYYCDTKVNGLEFSKEVVLEPGVWGIVFDDAALGGYDLSMTATDSNKDGIATIHMNVENPKLQILTSSKARLGAHGANYMSLKLPNLRGSFRCIRK
jgi:hypothetical protein